MSVLELYLLFTLLPALKEMAIITMVFGGFASIGAIIFHDELEARFKPAVRYLKVIMPIAVLLAVAIPTADQLKYIIGGSYVTNIENIEKLPPNMVDAANKFLEKMNESE